MTKLAAFVYLRRVRVAVSGKEIVMVSGVKMV